MKKIYIFIGAVFLISILASFVPALIKSKKFERSHQVTTSIPDDVSAIIDKSCKGCHSDDAKGIAKSKVNFTKWDSYDAKKKASKGEAICKVMTKGKMPPKSVRSSKPELIPTQEQIDLICKWTQSLAVK